MRYKIIDDKILSFTFHYGIVIPLDWKHSILKGRFKFLGKESEGGPTYTSDGELICGCTNVDFIYSFEVNDSFESGLILFKEYSYWKVAVVYIVEITKVGNRLKVNVYEDDDWEER